MVDDSRKFMYKGCDLDKVRNMDNKDFMNIIPSRLRRSIKRGFTPQQKLFMVKVKKARAEMDSGKEPKMIKTHCRNLVVLPVMIGLFIGVHNGREFVKTEIRPEMIGHYLGEFTYNRKRVAHHQPGIGATRGSAFVSVK